MSISFYDESNAKSVACYSFIYLFFLNFGYLQKHCGSSPLPYKGHKKAVFPYLPRDCKNFCVAFKP